MKFDPWDSIDCQSAFIERNYEDFEQWANEKGIYHDYYCDHEFDYCQSREDEFLDFAANFEEGLNESEGDKRNNLKGDR